MGGGGKLSVFIVVSVFFVPAVAVVPSDGASQSCSPGGGSMIARSASAQVTPPECCAKEGALGKSEKRGRDTRALPLPTLSEWFIPAQLTARVRAA